MSYNLLNPVHIIIAGDMSGNLTSPAVEVKLQDNIGVQLHWTGTPTGTFSFQVSMDHKEDIEGNIVTAGTSGVAGGACGSGYIEVVEYYQ